MPGDTLPQISLGTVNGQDPFSLGLKLRNVRLVIKSLLQDIFFSINTTEIVLKAKLLSLR